MHLLDVNILIYAHRVDQANHPRYLKRLTHLTASGEAWGTTPLVNAAFVRIVTNPKFPNGATPLPQALTVIDTLFAHPSYTTVHTGPNHWNTLRNLCANTGAISKRVSDAQHAAIAIDSGSIWISADSDFEVFKKHGLRWEHWE